MEMKMPEENFSCRVRKSCSLFSNGDCDFSHLNDDVIICSKFVADDGARVRKNVNSNNGGWGDWLFAKKKRKVV